MNAPVPLPLGDQVEISAFSTPGARGFKTANACLRVCRDEEGFVDSTTPLGEAIIPWQKSILRIMTARNGYVLRLSIISGNIPVYSARQQRIYLPARLFQRVSWRKQRHSFSLDLPEYGKLSGTGDACGNVIIAPQFRRYR